MVAFDKMDNKIGEIFSPFFKKFQFLIFVAMEKIACDDQLLWLKILNLCNQPLQVFFINGLRNRNTRFSEMPCFAKMQIGYDQRSFFFPKYRSVGR